MSTTTVKQSKLPSFLSLLLVIALGISLAKLMWLVLTPAPQVVTSDNSVTSNQTNNAPQLKKHKYGKEISDLHLFGKIKKVAVVAPPVEIKPKDTKPAPAKLDLKLHGIVAYKNKKGYALISSNGRKQKVYGKGDKIEEGVTVNDLFPEKVIINNHGTTEELILPRKTADKKSNASPQSLLSNNRSVANSAPQQRRNAASSSTPALPPSGIQNNSPSSSPSSGIDLGSFRDEMLKSPQKLMDVAHPSPAYDSETDKFIGFRLSPGSNRQIFREIGLRANDIVTSVNGINLDNPSKGAMVLGELAQASSISLVIKRGEEVLTLSHDF